MKVYTFLIAVFLLMLALGISIAKPINTSNEDMINHNFPLIFKGPVCLLEEEPLPQPKQLIREITING